LRTALITILLPALLLMSSVGRGMVICLDQGGAVHIETAADDCCGPSAPRVGSNPVEASKAALSPCEECSHLGVDLKISYLWQGFDKSEITPTLFPSTEFEWNENQPAPLASAWADGFPLHDPNVQKRKLVRSTIIRC
jgi:hypothetical protein